MNYVHVKGGKGGVVKIMNDSKDKYSCNLTTFLVDLRIGLNAQCSSDLRAKGKANLNFKQDYKLESGSDCQYFLLSCLISNHCWNQLHAWLQEVMVLTQQKYFWTETYLKTNQGVNSGENKIDLNNFCDKLNQFIGPLNKAIPKSG